MKSLRQNFFAVVFTFQGFTKRNLNFFVLINLFTCTCTLKSERVNLLSFFLFFSLRASPYGWICGVVSNKTPASIILCLKNMALPNKFTPLKECNIMVKYQNGKVYKLLTKIRASLNVLVIWLHRFGAEGRQKAVEMCWEKSCLQDQESTCNGCFNAFQTVMGQKCSWNRIYIWTMKRLYCKDPEFVEIICFDIALRGSYWPLAAELHWSYKLMPKSYCSCQDTLQLQWVCWSWHFFLSISKNLIHLTCFIRRSIKLPQSG